MGDEQPLGGGNVSAGVVRVGDTVRRPAGFWSASVDAFLRHLNSVGYEGAPRSLGFDEQGRHVLEFIQGDVPMPFDPPDHLAVRRVVAIADGYRLDEQGRIGLADLLQRRIMSMHDLLSDGHRTGAQPWSRLWAQGHGNMWLENADYVLQHSEALRAALVNSS